MSFAANTTVSAEFVTIISTAGDIFFQTLFLRTKNACCRKSISIHRSRRDLSEGAIFGVMSPVVFEKIVLKNCHHRACKLVVRYVEQLHLIMMTPRGRGGNSFFPSASLPSRPRDEYAPWFVASASKRNVVWLSGNKITCSGKSCVPKKNAEAHAASSAFVLNAREILLGCFLFRLLLCEAVCSPCVRPRL